MSTKDERIIDHSEAVRRDVIRLKAATANLESIRNDQRRLIRKLLRAGLTTRFVGKLSGMSHSTVTSIGRES